MMKIAGKLNYLVYNFGLFLTCNYFFCHIIELFGEAQVIGSAEGINDFHFLLISIFFHRFFPDITGLNIQ